VTGVQTCALPISLSFDLFNPEDYSVIALGGGGIITENFWFFKKGLDNKVKDLILLNVGLTTEAEPVFERLKNKIKLAVVRDKFSFDLALKYIPDVVYAPDITFLDRKISNKEDKTKNVSICLNYYIFNKFFSSNHRERIFAEKALIELASFVDWLSSLGYTPNLVPCHTDREVNDNVISALLNGFLNKKAIWHLESSKIENVIAKSDLVISSRYHSSLFALKAGIPFIDITHHSKNLNFLKDTGLLESSISYWNLELNALKEKYKKAINYSELISISNQYGVYCDEGWNKARSSILKLIQ
jgi:polysaccharide pyruvyl transferase WcaK-like protein